MDDFTSRTADHMLDYLGSDGDPGWVFFRQFGEWECLYNLDNDRKFVSRLARNLEERGLIEVRRIAEDERSDIERQLAEEEQPAESEGDLDPDAVIEELHYLEQHLASNESLLARAAFRRVFKTVTLYWNHDGGRYRELDRAEVESQHPFALTENTPIRVQNGRQKPRFVDALERAGEGVQRTAATNVARDTVSGRGGKSNGWPSMAIRGA